MDIDWAGTAAKRTGTCMHLFHLVLQLLRRHLPGEVQQHAILMALRIAKEPSAILHPAEKDPRTAGITSLHVVNSCQTQAVRSAPCAGPLCWRRHLVVEDRSGGKRVAAP